jgi:CPA1 family monovalent cation:H+ antiporter
MNAVLFVIIGLEVLAIRLEGSYLIITLSAIVIVLVARFLSVGVLILAMKSTRTFHKGVVAILTWGGLRGSIAIALALSLPAVSQRDLIIAATYAVVVFSIIVQGLTIGRLIASPSFRSIPAGNISRLQGPYSRNTHEGES